jgi:SusD family.
LAEAYVTNLYANTFGNWNAYADQNSEQINGIHWYKDRITMTGSDYKRWSYTNIRLYNEAIQSLENGNLPAESKNVLKGECLFMRAYTYFPMLMYHGGIPYITVPQNKDTDDLFVKRNSTKECFDLIVKDIDDAISLLPERIATTSTKYGHIDGSFAKAFKAKVLLYKASPQFNPGKPWSNAYWKEAFTASQDAYNQLTKNGVALAPEYGQIFVPERGVEVVFSVINSYPNKVASWDHGVRPGSESRGNAGACPTWEFVKMFPMADGKAYDDPTGKYAISETDLLQNFWKNRDPRFSDCIVWNGSIYEVSGKSGKRQYTALGIAHEMDDFGTNPNAGINSTNLNGASGFFIRKGSNLALKQSEVQQFDTDYIVMRFAEVMLNYAETANETGRSDIAIDMLKQIRKRAGIEAGADGNYGLKVDSREDIREAILSERNIELCFEGHRFWDLRRLRLLDRLNGTTKHGVEAIAINPDGSEMPIAEAKTKADKYQLTESDFKYIVHQIPFSGVKENSVPETYYFFPISKNSIDKNSNLEQNSNWGGSFNPALE